MLSQLVFSKLIRKSSKLALKRASFYKHAEIQQLFRFLLIGLELLLVFNLQSGDSHQLLLGLLFLYLLLVLATIIFQIVRTSPPWLQSEKMCYVDILFFTLFLFLGADLSHVFYLNFLIVPFCLSLKTGIQKTFPFLLLTFFILIAVGFSDSIQNNFENINKTVFWSGFILVLGYFFARWGNTIFLEGKKTVFQKRIQNFIQPNTGINVVCDFILTELFDFFAAKSCSILILETDEECTLRSIKQLNNRKKIEVQSLNDSKTRILKSGNLGSAFIYSKNEAEEKVFEFYNNQWHEQDVSSRFQKLAASHSSNSFIVVPLKNSTDVFGRLFVYGSREKPFTLDEAGFLIKLIEGIGIYLEHLKLSSKISEEAAELERQRIALDIHDSIIQPYIALQMGLTALSNKIAASKPVSNSDIAQLHELTRLGITDLREYIHGLKEKNGDESAFLPSVERFIAKFSEATCIQVAFEHENLTRKQLNGKLSAEIFQMICEGLSNVRKHTQSKRILLSLRCSERLISLIIENEGAAIKDEQLFLPKSLSQRAALCGGIVSVKPKPTGGVIVEVEIPVA